MAIKTISRLDAFEVQMDEDKFNGRLHAFSDELVTARDIQGIQSEDQPDYPPERPQGMSTNESNYYNSLIELSKPVEQGQAGINATIFESQKITYKDLAKNIILDTKAYLNVRNMLGEFNLCAMVFHNYTYKGNKTLFGSLYIRKDGGYSAGLNVEGQANITGTTTVGTQTDSSDFVCWGNINLTNDNTGYGKIHSNNLSAEYHNFQVRDIIDATGRRVIIKPQTTLNDTLTVQKATTLNDTLTVAAGKATTLGGTLTVNDTLTVAAGKATTLGGTLMVAGTTTLNDELTINSTVTATGKATFNSGITVTSGGASIAGNVGINGDLTCSNIKCGGVADLTAERAKWADLAECYVGDKKYEPGTLVRFGGENEVTVADNVVNGVVSTNPAYLMNSALLSAQNCCSVAYVGRVPVKVIGKIRKFDNIVLHKNGVAKRQCAIGRLFGVKALGKALESNSEIGVKLVECVVNFQI